MRRRHAPDRTALVLAIGVHGVLALLLLTLRPPLALIPPPDATLTLFDVAPPPPPPPMVVPPSLPLPPPPAPPRSPGAGGSPAAPGPVPAPMEHATVQPIAPPAPPAAIVTSPFGRDEDVGQLAGTGGSGNGGGAGGGSGLGLGAGDGGGVARYARAAWLYRPSNAELHRFWPAEAVRRRVSGRVALACVVPRSGRPHHCTIVTENPADLGFGAAALAMQPLFRIKPVLRNGKVLAIPVIVPVAFDVPPARKP